ncbi:MAG: MbtH family NRPS accessory protein [Saprospiraceae bacterium]|nr:MbtH family NRPS accessory protein [Saprospiraceae bacterium]
MENYYFTDHLVVKVTNPEHEHQHMGYLNPSYNWMPTLYLYAKAADLDKFEKILNELTVSYINDEKLCVYVLDGAKANLWYASNAGKMPEAVIAFRTYSHSRSQSELFSSFTRDAEMTKDRLKTWLERQMAFINKQPGAYDEEIKSDIEYLIVENGKGDYKLWSMSQDIPQGWKDTEAMVDNSDKAACIQYIQRLKAQ